MPSVTLNGHTFSSSLTYRGITAFVDQELPVSGKTEFGLDSLVRKMGGATNKLQDYLRTLKQGAQYSPGAGSSQFYLQNWTVDVGRAYSFVNLNYKGLATGALPDPTMLGGRALQSITVSCTSPAVAQRAIQYFASTGRWRFIDSQRPGGARFTNQDKSHLPNPQILTSLITVDNPVDPYESRYSGAGAPAGLVTALTPAVVNIASDETATPVIGTPFFECEETVTRLFLGA